MALNIMAFVCFLLVSILIPLTLAASRKGKEEVVRQLTRWGTRAVIAGIIFIILPPPNDSDYHFLVIVVLIVAVVALTISIFCPEAFEPQRHQQGRSK